jgi:hypothetical protein
VFDPVSPVRGAHVQLKPLPGAASPVRGAHAAGALCVRICAISEYKKPPGTGASPTIFAREHKKAASNDCWQAGLGGVVIEGISGLGDKYPPPPEICV